MKIQRNHLGSPRLAMIAATLLALALSGCTADSVDASGPASGSSNSTEDPKDVRAEAQKLIDTAAKGTSIEPDATPRPAAQGVTAVLVPNGMNNESSAVTVHGMQDACEAIGWTCTIVDAQSNPANYAGSIRQAIATKPDVIVTHGLDCSAVSLPLQEAATAGIVTINSTSYDCDVDGGEKLYTAAPLYNDFTTGKTIDYRDSTILFGKLRGAAIVLGVEDEPPAVIDVTDDEVQLLTDIHDATMDFVKRIPDAKLYQSSMKIADLGPKLESLVTGELLKYPDANAVSMPFGAAYTAGGGSAISKSGRQDLFVMGVEGIPAELDLIRAGVVDAAIYSPTAWTGWSSIDTANSVLTGAPIVNSGQGAMYVTKESLSDTPGEEPTVSFPDYQSAYKKAWGK